MMSMGSIEVNTLGLSMTFGSGLNSIELFKISRACNPKGERIAIVGSSARANPPCSTYLAPLEKPTGGKVLYSGEDVFLRGERELANFRNRNIGFVFQFHYLRPELNALENVMMPGLIAGLTRGEVKSGAEELLDSLGRPPGSNTEWASCPAESSKELQWPGRFRFAPNYFWPTSRAEIWTACTGRTLHELLVSLNETLGLTMVIVTHNQELARMMHRVLRLKDARLEEERGRSEVCSTASI